MNDIEYIFNERKQNQMLNTSYPLNPADWKPFEVKGTLPFCADDTLSFYIHIPFCKQLCAFCEYTRMLCPDEEEQRRYLEALSNDIAIFIKQHPQLTLQGFDIGGGTPTALSNSNFQYLLSIYSETIKKAILSSDFEPSIEGTFQTLNNEKFQAIADVGIRRVSLGVQTCNNSILSNYSRANTTIAEMRQMLDAARYASIDKINLDVMYGLRGETPETISRDIETLSQLRPEQITLYD